MKILTALKHVFVRGLKSEGFTAEVDSAGRIRADIPKDVKVTFGLSRHLLIAEA